MKATIKRVLEIDNNRFEVYCDGMISNLYCFRLNQSEDSIWNEKTNYERALRLAKLIESGGTKFEETIYETPDDIPNEIFQTHQT